MSDFFDVHTSKLAQFNAQFRKRTQFSSKIDIPSDPFSPSANSCGEPILHEELITNHSYVCPSCNHYFIDRRANAHHNARPTTPASTNLMPNMTAKNPLEFPDYAAKAARQPPKSAHELEAVRLSRARRDRRHACRASARSTPAS
ncbi:MAG: hypothetical protein MZU97_05165 [Bacillus subtilis]|nr:hypothetical protein [Bacillus subtilis]